MESFIQEEGMVDIVCLSEPEIIIKTDIADVTLTLYSNNEPHIHLINIKKVSKEAIEFAKEGLEEIKKKFNELGYDKIYTLIKDTDTQSKRLMSLVGFIPKVIYETDVGIKYIKYDMETV